MPFASAQDSICPDPIPLGGDGLLEVSNRPLVMGVLNITPDSFSDGGHWLQPDRAVARAEIMVAEGADLLDLGAESTRPGGGVYGNGAKDVPADEELRRLLPVLTAVRRRVPVPISVDTRKAAVAREAIDAGADIVNDISALADPDMAEVVARAGCPIVLMHSRGRLDSMQTDIDFKHVVDEVTSELANLTDQARARGIPRQQILIDPGIGFGKTVGQNLQLLRHLDRVSSIGQPVLVGASRKSFIGEVGGAEPGQRLPGSLAAAAWAAHHGVAIIRVHDVAETIQFLDVWDAIRSTWESTG